MEKSDSVYLDINGIAKILPHRYPFLLVDKILEIHLEDGWIVGQKSVTMNEPFFQGHFPKFPIMPGVLILEALAQTAGVFIHQKGYQDRSAFLLNVNNAKFRRPVVPGDSLELHVQSLHLGSRAGKVVGKAMVEKQLAAQAEIGFALKALEEV